MRLDVQVCGKTVAHLYRERDEIEKSFKALKSEIDILPLNTHSDKTTRGFIFIAFLSLIIRSRLINMMREAKLMDKYSVELFRGVSRDLNMLFLVGAHRHDGGIVEKNVGRHETWIIKKPNIYFFVFGLGIFVRMRAHQIRHGRDAIKNPIQFVNLWYI